MSFSFKVIHASIPSPERVAIKITQFLTGTVNVQALIGFPHPKSISYKGNLVQLLKVNTSAPSPPEASCLSSLRGSIAFAKPSTPCSFSSKPAKITKRIPW